MSNKTDYNEMLPLIEAMPKAEIKKPTMPVEEVVNEAEDLYPWSLHDKEELLKAGIPESHFNLLKIFSGALRLAESNWKRDDKDVKDAELVWREESPEAFKLHQNVLRSFRYAFRKDEDLMRDVKEIDEGNTISDMIQDLSDMSVLGRANLKPLEGIGFDVTLLDKCDDVSAKMGDIRGQANGEKQEANESLLSRNKIYTLGMECMADIRACGKYVFWDQPDRLDGYISKYNQTKYAKRKQLDQY